MSCKGTIDVDAIIEIQILNSKTFWISNFDFCQVFARLVRKKPKI